MAVSDEIKEQQKKLKDMTFKGKVSYIWEYYKIHMIVATIVIIGVCVFIRDFRENQKPTHIYAAFINCNFNFDTTNTLEDDYVRTREIDTSKEHVYFSYDINLDPDYFDTASLAFQQKLVSLYQAGEIDIVAGPVGIMETSADCNGYADITKILPQDLLDELADREYEFYYYPGHKYDEDELSFMDEEERALVENFEPYIAGIYLDTCSYLNNMGEYGAYDLTDDESKRPILTIPVTTKRPEAAIDFIRFIIE